MADLAPYGLPGRFEQFWARDVSESIFQVCCIPFFTYGIALGDTVKCDGEFTVQAVVERSGHKNLRLTVADPDRHEVLHSKIHDWVVSTGLLYEFCSPGYLAVDLPPGFDPKDALTALSWSIPLDQLAIEVDDGSIGPDAFEAYPEGISF
jgi:hypothetical protein